VSSSIYTRLPWDEDDETYLAAEVAPAAPDTSPPKVPASREHCESIMYDPDERLSAVKKWKPYASHSFVEGKFKERRNRYKMKA
jgi:hypothetical protein